MTYCHECGIEAPTRHVEFYQNIGVIATRLTKRVKSELCSRCIRNYFWRFTGITFFLGWWSATSLLLTPFILLNNVGRYIVAWGLEAPSPNVVPPILTEVEIEKLSPYTSALLLTSGNGASLDDAAPIIAKKAGVTPGHVILFFDQLVRLANAQK